MPRDRFSLGGDAAWRVEHVEDIIRKGEAEPFEVRESLLLISIGDSFKDERMSVYDAVRGVWKVNKNRAQGRLVLARYKSIVVGAFRPDVWLLATEENFPKLIEHYGDPDLLAGRWGFIGEPAESVDWGYYVWKQVPDRFLGQNPVRYCDPDTNPH